MYKKNRNRFFVILAAVLVLGFLYIPERKNRVNTDTVVLSESEDLTAGTDCTAVCTSESTEICVYVTGCVVSPGVFTVPEGTRIYEVLELAGGFTEDADRNAVNLAETVYDGEAVLIPSVSETMNQMLSSGQNGLININTADLDELMTLPGIGGSKAESIISYREEYGGFDAAEDLMKVSGIGQSTFDRLKNRIRV